MIRRNRTQRCGEALEEVKFQHFLVGEVLVRLVGYVSFDVFAALAIEQRWRVLVIAASQCYISGGDSFGSVRR